MLRVAPTGAGVDAASASPFLSVDKKRKQITLQEPTPAGGGVAFGLSASMASLDSGVNAAASQDRRAGVAAPKMFAFDGLFTQDDAQVTFTLL